MLIIVNPYATTVSDRLKNLVVYALQGRFEVETVSTEAQNHATEIGREVRDHGYDVVVAFGGDGTLNEVANGLAGTDVPVSVLPGRLDQRRLPHARHPQRRRRRDRAPADPGRRVVAAQDRPGQSRRALLRLLLRGRDRRDGGQARRRPPAPEVEGRAVLLHLVGRLGLLPQLPAQPGPASGRDRRRRPGRGRDGAGPELRPLHLLRQPPGARLRERRDRRRHALGGRARACRPARHAHPDPEALQRGPARRPPPADRALRRRARGDRDLDLHRPRRRPAPLSDPARRRLHRRGDGARAEHRPGRPHGRAPRRPA